jgi:hypothetical protein
MRKFKVGDIVVRDVSTIGSGPLDSWNPAGHRVLDIGLDDRSLTIENDPDPKQNGHRHAAYFYLLNPCPVVMNQTSQNQGVQGQMTGGLQGSQQAYTPSVPPAVQPFNPGDIVECQRTFVGGDFTAGRNYTVKQYVPAVQPGGGGHVLIEKDNLGQVNGWSEVNFRLVTSAGRMPSGRGAFMDAANAAIIYGTGMMKIVYDEPKSSKCECGCLSVGISKHSDYCPLYERE